MGKACSVNGGEERHMQGFGGGNLRERDHLGDTGVGGIIILKWIINVGQLLALFYVIKIFIYIK